MIEAAQIRAARALLEWSQGDLVIKSGLSLTTVKRMESASIGPGKSSAENVAAVQLALEAAGVQFIPKNGGGAGVRLGEAERMKAPFPPAYDEALEALRACAKAFTPERYAFAAMALAKCWDADATSAMEPETALRANIRIADDNTLMRLAAKVDALHQTWKVQA